MLCVHGYQIAIIGNNGPIYPESAEKGASFIQLCNKRNIPLKFLNRLKFFSFTPLQFFPTNNTLSSNKLVSSTDGLIVLFE